jgi:hypothetical protein
MDTGNPRRIRIQSFAFGLVLGALIFLGGAIQGNAEEGQGGGSSPSLSSVKDSRIPAFTLTRPNWALQLSGTARAFAGQDVLADQQGRSVRAGSVSMSYQPGWFQGLGVFSLGLTGGLNYMSDSSSVLSRAWSIWQMGGEVRYQLRYFREQPLVPFLGYEAGLLSYRLQSGASGRPVVQGPVYGLMILLNFFEPDAAAEFYIRQGVSRTYLVAEAKSLTGSDSSISISGRTYFFGLRFEF